MRRAAFYVCIIVVLGAHTVRAQEDSVAYRAAESTTGTRERIQALEQFVKTYPTSRFSGNASLALFNFYAEQGQEGPALEYAGRYLNPIPPANRMSPYNSIAYTLALRNIGLDSAIAYANRASEMARSQGSGMLSAIEDTRALAVFRHGDAAGAEKIQQSIMPGHEGDPEYLEHLAMYQAANGKRREALKTAAQGLYLGGTDDLRDDFTTWLRQETPDSTAQDALKQSIVMGIVRSRFDSLAPSEVIGVRSTAARFMAGMGVHLTTARQWAQDAVADIGNKTPVEEAVAYKRNLAIVTSASGNDREALTLLRSVEKYVTPWESDFWMSLGSACERTGDPNGAIDAYIEGLTVLNSKEIRQALDPVYTKVHGSLAGLEADIDKAKQRGASIEPGRFEPSEQSHTGRTVLAELFTGAECGPCVGSDMAFDALRDYFPASDLVILEYHVHIPGPDPLTTNDSWDRYQQYKGQGTPTAVFDGSQKLIGGGPRYIARNRFNVYQYAIDAAAAVAPPVSLSATAKAGSGTVDVDVHIEKTASLPNSAEPVLHIALVERAVNYTGANGISKHAFVVRKLFYGPKGTPILLNGQEMIIHAHADLGAVEADMAALLNDPTHQSSWPQHARSFGGWKPHPDHLNRSNLGVAVWVQDMKSMDVLQSAYIDVPPLMDVKSSPMTSGGSN